MIFFDWLLGRTPLGTVDHWTPERARHYERLTYRYLGIRPEPVYPWARKFRAKQRKAVKKVLPFGQRKETIITQGSRRA